MNVLVTVPPYAEFVADVVRHPLVCGVRVNTAMPYRISPYELLQRFRNCDKPVWVDLKGRQLRVVGGAVPPFTAVQLSHRIHVPTPCLASFGSGREVVRVLAVEGDRLFLEDGPRRYIGPGESVNILHPRLRIEGYLTGQDEEYLQAMARLGMTNVMLSFFEHPSDLELVRTVLPQARVVVKLESARGLDQLNWIADQDLQAMVARGDLLTELGCPLATLQACRRVVERLPDAWIASRFLTGLSRRSTAELAEVADVAHCLSLGYRVLMLGDEVCQRGDTVLNALHVLQGIAELHQKNIQPRPDSLVTSV